MNGDRWERLAALTGVAVGVLFFGAIALVGDAPKANAPGGQVAGYFAEHRSSLLAGLYLEGLAAVAMMWFFGVVRSALGRAEGASGRLANVALVAGAVQAGLYILSSGFWGALAYMSNQTADAVTATAFYRLGAVAFQVGALPFAVALFSIALVGLRSRVLPVWLTWVTALFGVVAVVVRAIPEETYGPERFGRVAFLLVPLWFAALGIVLARRPAEAGQMAPVEERAAVR
jgi:hypothetical protein